SLFENFRKFVNSEIIEKIKARFANFQVRLPRPKAQEAVNIFWTGDHQRPLVFVRLLSQGRVERPAMPTKASPASPARSPRPRRTRRAYVEPRRLDRRRIGGGESTAPCRRATR